MSTTKVCTKCGYKDVPDDSYPFTECPKCNHVMYEQLSRGKILDDYTKIFHGKPPRYRYYPEEDELYLLIDANFVDKMGMVIDDPNALPYYVRMEDRLGRIGVWLYWPDIKMNRKFKETILWS